MNAITALFRRKTAAEVEKEQLFEADRLYLEHQAAGELHCCLAEIYKLRANRLRPVEPAKAVGLHAVGAQA
jgi:hypothetical protein